jgi:hypothetical protein
MSSASAERLVPDVPPGEDELPCQDGVPMDTEIHDLLLGFHPTRTGSVEAQLLRWFDRAGNLLPLESERAEAERLRAESEKLRAESERLRADGLAARLAEYERRFGAVAPE